MQFNNYNNLFLAGDSHLVDFSIALGINNFQTLGGYGLFSIFDKDTLRPVPEAFRRGVEKYFNLKTSNDVILLSYLDTESRTGIGKRAINNPDFKQYYKDNAHKTFEYLRKISKYKQIIFLDMFAVKKEVVGEQTCSGPERLFNRKMLNSIINEIGNNYNISLLSIINDNLLCDAEGFTIDDNLVPDGVHYNLNFILKNNLTVKDYLYEIFHQEIKKFL